VVIKLSYGETSLYATPRMKKKKEQKNQTKKSGFALDDRPGSNTCESGKLERTKKKNQKKNQKCGFALDDRPGSNTCESGKLERIKKCAEGGGTKYT
jgi:hypothetical protein